MDAWIAAAFGVAGTVVAAIFGYLTAARKTSGKIDTTEAATLWAQMSAALLREDTRNKLLEARVDELSRKVGELETKLATAEIELAEARKREDVLGAKNATLAAKLDELRQQFDDGNA